MNSITISFFKDKIFEVELTLANRSLATTIDRVIYFENKLTLDATHLPHQFK